MAATSKHQGDTILGLTGEIMVLPCPEKVRALTWEMKPPAWEDAMALTGEFHKRVAGT